jgi:phytoene synthase
MSDRGKTATGSQQVARPPSKTATSEAPLALSPQALLQASYAFCRRTARRSGSSFYPCFLVLGAPKRRAMEALYAFARHTDDLADSAEPLDVRRKALRQWRIALDAALAGQPTPAEAGGSDTRLLPALIDTLRAFGIPAEHLHAVIEGGEMDLEIEHYETFDQLAAYCHRVASSVGLACLHIWGFHGHEAFAPARSCGLAFQLTNILRDLKEDAARGRVYLPQEDLRRFGYSIHDLRSGRADQRFGRLMEFEIDRVRTLYREAAGLPAYLEPDGQRICRLMIEVYRRLLERIATRPEEVLLRRVRLGPGEKLRIAARWLLTSLSTRE